ncbi:MAG: ABC transporter permease [Anaerolineaceae bacterium]|nr:MAG: ABC transporter permease [Anaerolineaceae bacterium]
MNLRATMAIARKDFLDALKNARLLVIILMPIGFSVLYGYLFRDTLDTMEIVIYSPDTSSMVSVLSELDAVSLFVVDSPEAVETKLEEEKAIVGVVLPPQFDLAVRAGERPALELIYRENPEDARGTQRMILQTIEQISGRQPIVSVIERSLQPPGSAEEAEAREPMSFFREIDLQSFFIVLWVMMGITMNGSFLVPTLLVEEKDKKTLDAILVTPTNYLDVLTGKVLVGVLYCLLTSLTVMALNQGFAGDVGFSLTVVLLASVALTLIGLLIGGLIDNLTTLNTWGSFVMLPLMLPGILAGVPLGTLGPALTIPLQVVPTYHLVRGLGLSLSGEGGEVWMNLVILAVECVVLFGAVLWSMRRREA